MTQFEIAFKEACYYARYFTQIQIRDGIIWRFNGWAWVKH